MGQLIFCWDDTISCMAKMKLISDRQALNECVRAAKKSKWIGVDTEFLREKTYYPLLCLIQMRTESESFCIDVLAIEDLIPLQEVLADKNSIKIIHACRQDLEALAQRLDDPICNLYDTQIAAAFCGYGEQVSYAALVESICRVRLEKSHTRTDWSARPLSPAQLQYAVDDVNYLDRMQESLDRRLAELGRQAWHHDECEKVLKSRDYRINPKDAWKRLKGAAKIPIRHQPSAKALSIWRERKAQQRNRPREWILSTRALTEICIRQPASLVLLSGIESVNAGVVRNSGAAILNVLKSNAPKSNACANDGASPIWENYAALDKQQKKRVKAIMNELKSVAEQANISESMLANRNDIEALIAGKTNIPLLEGWRYEFIGKRILAEFA